MKNQKLPWAHRQVIQAPFYFTLCCCETEFYQELRELNIRQHEWPPFLGSAEADATVWAFSQGDKTIKLVCIAHMEGRTGIEIAGLLTHEAVHLWQGMCDTIGEEAPSREFEAYSIQYFSQQLWGLWLQHQEHQYATRLTP